LCGIAGWVDFTQDLRHQQDVIAAMTASLSHRGPDGEGTWVSAHAAIGNRRLAVVDIPGGRQPMSARRCVGDEPVVLTYNGELYNATELRTELAVRGHLFSSRCDTEVILRAYLEWGTGLAERLVGMYAFAIWDGPREELILVRDRLGVKPLYYYAFPGGVLFGSEPKVFWRNPMFCPRVCEEALPILFNPRLAMPGETPLTGLRQVQPGHLVRADRSGAHEAPYWRLVSREHRDDEGTTVRTVRELLDDIVTHQQLMADVPVCTLLSGGLDSSAVTALMAARQPGQLCSFSVDFTGATGDFRSTPLRPDRDAPFAAAASRYIGTAHSEVLLDPAELGSAVPMALAARDLPSLGQFDASMFLFFERIRKEFTVALSGEAGDEIFGGYPWFFDPATVHGDTFPWLGNGPRLTDYLAPDVRARIRPGDDEKDRYRTLLARVPRLSGETGLQARMREVLFLSLQSPLVYLLDRKDRMSMAVGLEVRVPYCDHRLVEYVWNVPWAMKCSGGREKGLLRSAVADVLPAEVLERRKSAYPATFGAAHTQQVRRELEDVVTCRSSPLAGLVDAERIRALADSDSRLMAFADPLHLLLPLVEVDRWLRSYNLTFA
jgi:asparagine synthase (glutamine-hydrolysing)